MTTVLNFFLVLTVFANVSLQYSTSAKEKAICLNAHNKLRSLHKNTPAFVWDDGLAARAQKWADYLTRYGRLTHDMNSDDGENLYWAQSFRSANGGDSSAKGVLAWYNEIDAYDFRTGRSNGRGIVGHFTQLVWQGTTKLGCGMAVVQKNGRYETFLVSRYGPRGNFVMRKWGESSSAAHQRVYSENVQQRVSGAVTPTLDQLMNGGSVLPTGGPQPSTTQPPPSNCVNKRGDGYCNYILRCGNNYLCNGRYSSVLKEDCYKSCTSC